MLTIRHDHGSLLGSPRAHGDLRLHGLWLLADNGRLSNDVGGVESLLLVPKLGASTTAHGAPHFLLLPKLLLLLAQALILPLVEERPAHLLAAPLYLLHQVQLAHLVHQLLVLPLLRRDLLLLEPLLALLLLLLLGAPLALLYLLHEEPAPHAAWPAVFPGAVLH